MIEVEVTVRMPRDVFDEAVAKLREWDHSAEGERRWAQENASDYPLDAAHCLFRAAMLEHTPPWEPTDLERAGLRQVELKWLRGGDGRWSYQPVYRIDPEHPDHLSALLQRHDEAVRDAAYLGRLAASSSWPGEMAYRVQKVADRAADRLAALDREVPDDPR